MKKLSILLFLVLAVQAAAGQTPKWVEKAKQAVFSVITYDASGKILNKGNGFFIDESGTAVSDYSLFKGAERAVIVNPEGKELPVTLILGANEMYDLVKFRVATGKKVPALEIAGTVPVQGAEVYMLPYSVKKNDQCLAGQVKEISPVPGGFHYYTLAIPYSNDNVSCPVADAGGKVFAMMQKSSLIEKDASFAIGVPFARSLSITALSVNDPALQGIGIKKALPEDAEQALVYLFLNSSQLAPEAYLSLLDDFIAQFPGHPEGYLRRAALYVDKYRDEKHFSLAEDDLKQALKLAGKKDDVHYNYARLIYNNELTDPAFNYKDWGTDKALAEIGQALAIDPLPLYRQLEGDIYFARQDYAKAFESYDLVNRSNLASPLSYYSAAKAKELSGGTPTEILALLDSAMSSYDYPLRPDAAPYIWERARMRAQNNQPKEAVMDYNVYYELLDGQVNDLFYYFREQSNYKLKQFKLALDDIDKALEQKPDDAVYLAERGAVLLRLARYDEAIGSLEAALAIDPQFSSCYRIIGYCQLQQGKKEEACRNFTKAKELGDEAVDKLIETNCR